jgi:hypothetical protein
MLEKTMKQVLNKKINTWKQSIKDEDIKQIIDENLIITGGCFTSMIENNAPNDFDCYFRDKQSVLKIAQYYADIWNKKKEEQNEKQTNKLNKKCKVMVLDGANPSQEIKDYFWNLKPGEETGAVIIDNCPPERVKMVFPSDGFTGDPEEANGSEELGVDSIKYTNPDIIKELDEIEADKEIKKEKEPYFPVFISSNAITLSDGIQVTIRFYGEPTDIHETYDFAHTKAYYDYGKDILSIPTQVYECVINKTLIYTGSKYPVCSIFRLRKFVQRGWKINAGQMLKICMQISQLDLMDINILEDQLIGVDSVYFIQLIEQFRKQKEKDPNFDLTSEYIVSIIDKIF